MCPRSNKIIDALALADISSYTICIILSPVSLYQLRKHVLLHYKGIKAPSYWWIIVLTLTSMITSKVLHVLTDTAEYLLPMMMFRLADLIATGVKMPVFGIVTSTFKQKCENIGTETESHKRSLQLSRELLSEFQSLKKACQSWLFVEFSCNTVSLICWAYICITSMQGCNGDIDGKAGIVARFLITLTMILGLTFYALTAHDCWTSFSDLATKLR